MPLEPYSPEFGRKWADDPKETRTVTSPPIPQFQLVTQVVLVEQHEQRDEPPGRAPYKEVRTVLAERKKPLGRHQVADAVAQVSGDRPVTL